MIFKDREEAATLLLKKLEKYKGTNPLVLGIPRGAIPMAKIIASGLEGELSAILVHKIPAPFNEEFAIGSIGLSGEIKCLIDIDSEGIPESYLTDAAKKQLNLLKQRQQFYGLKKPNYKDRVVIIVDDGIATGATTLAAIHEVRLHQVKKLIVATPVASKESAKRIKSLVDDFVVLSVPEPFYAVGQFFSDFSQVSDEEVIEILKNILRANDF